jgi:hypothetical protein
MDRVGLEPTALALSKTPIPAQGTRNGTQDGTPKGENAPIDPDLARLIEAWPKLDADTRAAILRTAGVQ